MLIPDFLHNSMGPPIDTMSRGLPSSCTTLRSSYSFTPTTNSTPSTATCLPNIPTQSGPLPPMVSQMT